MSLRRLLNEHKAFQISRFSGEDDTRWQNHTATHTFTDSNAYRRIHEDLNNLHKVKSMIEYCEQRPFQLQVQICPSSGYWCGGVFHFMVHFSPEYPERGPTVQYLGPNRIFHPNIDGDESTHSRWGVCLGVQTNWHQSFTVSCVIEGLEQLFETPSFDDHLYGTSALAAKVYNKDRLLFAQYVQFYLHGEYDKNTFINTMAFGWFGKTRSEKSQQCAENTSTQQNLSANDDNEDNAMQYATKQNINKLFGSSASTWMYPTRSTSVPGGEYEFTPGLNSVVNNTFKYIYTEYKRPKGQYVIADVDNHRRVPQWVIDKNIAIDGTPLSQTQIKAPSRYEGKYSKQLALAQIDMIKKDRRYMQQNNAFWYWLKKLGRAYGLSEPINEQLLHQLQHHDKSKKSDSSNNYNQKNNNRSNDNKKQVLQSSSQLSSQHLHKNIPVRGAIVQPAEREPKWNTPWEVLLESVQTGKPLIRVGNKYRPRIDFYSIDGFIDSAPSFIWFWCKLGMFIGLTQGAVVAFSVIKKEYMYFRASGISPFTFLHSSLIGGTLKWGGNYTAFAMAFIVGDRLARKVKQYLLPTQEQNVRTCSNYVVGFSCVGAATGIVPWWLLNDYYLARRMAISGICVGGLLGIVVYYMMNCITVLNMELYDASDRDWRKYEALILRQRRWKEMEQEKKKRRVASESWV